MSSLLVSRVSFYLSLYFGLILELPAHIIYYFCCWVRLVCRGVDGARLVGRTDSRRVGRRLRVIEPVVLGTLSL